MQIETMILEQQESFNVPGLAIGILKEGEIIYANGFGVQNLSTQDSLTTTSIFHKASLSKFFVANAIMKTR